MHFVHYVRCNHAHCRKRTKGSRTWVACAVARKVDQSMNMSSRWLLAVSAYFHSNSCYTLPDRRWQQWLFANRCLIFALFHFPDFLLRLRWGFDASGGMAACRVTLVLPHAGAILW
jgi:hypothetical protein